MTRPQITTDEVRELPPVVDVPTAARVLGTSIRVPSGPLLELVGVAR